MLRFVTLTNVRRHANTHIDFTGEGQLISLAGFNGAGKTTVLEAILYALYGETRHGRSGIAGMVRRGAEHEGMEVTLGFTLDNVDYDVTRRYEKGKSTASLKAAGKETMRSVAAVTAEISRILGMDSTGFKLATIAKQKELDGLADLTPAKRRAAVARLLRLDAISAAARNAREEYTRSRDLAKALTAQADVPAAKAISETETKRLSEAQEALADQRAVVDELRATVLAGKSVAGQWEEKSRESSAAQGRVDSADSFLHSAQARLSKVVIPSEPQPFTASSEVGKLLESLNEEISAGEHARAMHSTRERLTRDIAASVKLAAELTPVAQCLNERVTNHRDAAATMRQAALTRDEISAEVAALSAKLATADERVRAAEARSREISELGDVCGLCEQSVSEEHQQRQSSSARGNLANSHLHVSEAQNELSAAQKRYAHARAAEIAAKENEETCAGLVSASSDAERRLEDTNRSLETYRSTMERLKVGEFDLDDLYARKAQLEAQRASSLAQENTVREIAAASVLHEQLREMVDNARNEHQVALNALQEAKPGEDLVAAWEELDKAKSLLDSESDILTQCSDVVSNASGALRAANAAVASAEALSEQADLTRGEALIASKAHAVLNAAAQTMATELRPALQAEVSTLLATLSEGRFTSVSISDDYSVLVKDTDGSEHPVSEFSGGESDLIALAIRLALAQIVARRNGAHASGFLILDEVLGSQDERRRTAILDGLRRLRNTYGQILLISHVGGLEDASDRVITIEEIDDVAVAS
jgi:exonuclease SbcC